MVKTCVDFPFFGANYPDATCIDGYLFDLDDCDDNGNLYYPGEDIPCPCCNKEKFIERFGEENHNIVMETVEYWRNKR